MVEQVAENREKMARTVARGACRFLTMVPVIIVMLIMGCATNSADQAATPGQDRWYIQHAHAYLSTQMGVKSPADEFQVKQVERDNLGKVHLRMVQQVEGVPVWGHVLLLHMDEGGAVYRVDGKVFQGLSGFHLPPLIGIDEALRRGLSAESADERIESHGLYLYVDNMERGVVPIYEVEVTEGLRRRFFLLDARSGAVVKRVEGSPGR